jgi:hypothetical protein
MFTGGSSEKFRIAPDQVQIDTTHFRPQHHVKSAVFATNIAVNRTAVIADFFRRVGKVGLTTKYYQTLSLKQRW